MTWNKGQGEAYLWIMAHKDYAGDECLPWPFSANWDGYPHFGYNGKCLKAGRFLCRLIHGEPPTPKHQAAHSCGRGNKGCMNRNHLSWKTPSGNQLDRRLHGTSDMAKGSRTSLTNSQVAEIRATKGIISQLEMARRLKVTRSVIEYWRKTTHEPKPMGMSRGAIDNRKRRTKATQQGQ